MKYFIQLTLLIFITVSCYNKVPKQQATTQQSSKKFAYETVEGDPLQTRIYTLDNGFKVYLSVNKDKPRIQTYISVNAGSKNDPADATGLAHYLEHMLFKGSTHMGTINYAKEKVLLDQIESQFEVYRQTSDSLKRKTIYHIIDSLSFEASKYAVPNEYDRLVAQIGANGTNAFTMPDATTYVNNIPSNQLSNWLKIEYERFQYPVFRLFHTELEAVYEEKNIGLDNDVRQAYERILHDMFLKHPYGTQTSIGTIEHLKNPSLKKIKEFYNTYYVPNNMALVMAGDFNPDSAIVEINKTLGNLSSKTIPDFTYETEEAMTAPRNSTVYGSDGEFLMMGYPLNIKPFTKDAYILTMVDRILNNAYAGLIDVNLNQQQKVAEAGTYLIDYNDYAAHIFYAYPTQNQSLEQAQELLFEQIEKLKKGEFPDWLISAIVKNLKLENQQHAESIDGRARIMLSAFNRKVSYDKVVKETEEIEKINKADVIAFCNKTYSRNCVSVFKKTSQEKGNLKVQKPIITPIQINRENSSEFAKEMAKSSPAAINPVYADFTKEFSINKLSNGGEIWYKQNKENNLFSLNIHYNFGSYENPLLETAINYLENLGTSKMTNAQINEAFYKIACSYSFSVQAHETNINISGLSESMPEALNLIKVIFNDAQIDEEALKRLKMKMLKIRNDEKLSKDAILWKAMSGYVLYGNNSPWLNRPNPKQIEALKAEDLLKEIKKLWSYKNEVCYYGDRDLTVLSNMITPLFGQQLIDGLPKKIFNKKEMTKNEYYVVDYNMQQASIGIYTRSKNFDASIAPVVQIFNEYFGGDMSSITFQEIREAKALAYGVGGSYNEPYFAEEPYTFWGMIGTQADKMKEALLSMDTIIRKVPYSEEVWNTAHRSLMQNIETGRITKTALFATYRNNMRLGYNYDRRKDLYEALPKLTFEQMAQFQQDYLSTKNFAYLILGNLKSIDLKWLEKQGEVHVLTLEQIFGY